MSLQLVDQAFIQKLMAMKAMSTTEALKQYNRCETHEANMQQRRPRHLHDIQALGQKLENINSLRSAYSPWERKTFWVLINTVEDEAGHAATVFSKQEIAMFYEIIEDLLESEGQIPLTRSHELGRGQGLTVADAGAAVQRMERLRWFKIIKNINEDVMLVFGPRAITEIPRIRTFVRSYDSNLLRQPEEDDLAPGRSQDHRPSNQEVRRSSRGSQRRAQHGSARNDSDDDVIIQRSSRERGPLPRMSQENELMDIDESQYVRDDDEDDVQPSQSRSQRQVTTRSRSTRASRRSSRRTSQRNYEFD